MPAKNYVLFLSLCISLSSFSSRADDATNRTEDSWEAISDEPSRSELFDDFVIPSYLDEEKAHPELEAVPFALPGVFHFPHSAVYDDIEHKNRENSIFGIDISHYTSRSLSLDQLGLLKVRFVYVKATQGARYKDDNFSFFWEKLETQKPVLYRGAYHFLSSSDPGDVQCRGFVQYLKLHGGLKSDDLAPVIDLEWDRTSTVPDRWVGRGADYIIAQVLGCAKAVETGLGRKPIIYTAKSWFSSKTIPLSRFGEIGGYKIWIADYNPRRKLAEKPATPLNKPSTLWQFSDRALLTGAYSRGVDASIFYGSDDDFKQAFLQ